MLLTRHIRVTMVSVALVGAFLATMTTACNNQSIGTATLAKRESRKTTLTGAAIDAINDSSLAQEDKAAAIASIQSVPPADDDTAQNKIVLEKLAEALLTRGVSGELVSKVTLGAAARLAKLNEDKKEQVLGQSASNALAQLQTPEFATMLDVLNAAAVPPAVVLEALVAALDPSDLDTPEKLKAVLDSPVLATFDKTSKETAAQNHWASALGSNQEPLLSETPQTDAAPDAEGRVIVALPKATDRESGQLGQALRYVIVTAPTYGSIDALPADATAGGSVVYTPANGYLGQDMWSYKVCDSSAPPGCTEPVTVNIENKIPTSPNPPPTIATVADQTIAEDTALNNLALTLIGPAGPLTCSTALQASASPVALVPLGGLVISGEYPNCLLSIAPAENQNGSATVNLTASDGELSAASSFALTVTAVNDRPIVAAPGAASASLAMDSPTTIGLDTATDPDVATDEQRLSYVIITPPDHGSLSVLPDSALSSSSVTYTPVSGYSGSDSFSYTICDSDTSPMCTTAKTVALTVFLVNRAPSNIALNSTTLSENAGANATVGSFTTTDPDAGNTFTYTLVAGGDSTDNTSFDISGDSLIMKSSANFEAKNSYSVRVRSTDQDGLFVERAFSIEISNENEAPTNIDLSSSTLAENLGANAAVGNLSTSDPDASNTFTYTLVSGTGDDNNAAFDISGGSLIMLSPANFETKNSYSVRVRSTDQGGLFFEKELSIAISNENEAPTDIDLNSSTLPENGGANATVGTLSSSDHDASNTFTYSLVNGTGDDNNAAFDISGSSLVMKSSADFETKNSYSVRVRSTDQGGLFFEKEFSIAISDENEAPTDIDLNSSTLPENGGANATVGTLSTSDFDASNTFTYSLVSGTGDDNNAAFEISGDSLVMRANANFEATSSYSVRIQTRDQGGMSSSFAKSFTITISDVNEAPSISALSDTQTLRNTPTPALVFTITDPDASNASTPACNSSFLSYGSDNTAVVAATGAVTWGGSWPNCTATVAPVSNASGSAVISIAATDGSATGSSQTFVLTVNAPPSGATAAGVTVGDLFYARLNAAYGSVVFPDSSSQRAGGIGYGGVAMSTEQMLFGGNSAKFDGAQMIAYPHSSALDLSGRSEWTIQLQYYRTASSIGVLLTKDGRSNVAYPSYSFTDLGNGTVRLYIGSGNGITQLQYIDVGPIAINTWSHLAFTRSNNRLYGFSNGNLDADAAITATMIDGGNALTIGAQRNGNTYGTDTATRGFIREVAITPQAIWTDDFTPPTNFWRDPSTAGAGFQTSNITYAQSSLWGGAAAASNAIMTDGSFNNTGTATNAANPEWVRMDLGADYDIATLCLGTGTSNIPGGWNNSYTGGRQLFYSTSATGSNIANWTFVFSTPVYPADGIYCHAVNFRARYIWFAASTYLAISEFHAIPPT